MHPGGLAMGTEEVPNRDICEAAWLGADYKLDRRPMIYG
jgi:hypothetical protein